MIIQALQKVFRKPMYSLFALVTSVAVFAFAVWLPNLSLIVRLMGHPGISFSQKLDLPLNLLGSIVTNFSVLSASYTIAIAILFGINLAMIVYYLQKRKSVLREAGVATSFGGFMSGIFGIGCAACGSFILSTLGASGAIALLPLRGSEFGILSVGLLAVSTFSVSKRINEPGLCNTKSS